MFHPWRWFPAPRLPDSTLNRIRGHKTEQDPTRLLQERQDEEHLHARYLHPLPLDRVEHFSSGIPVRLGDRWAGFGTSGAGKTTAFQHIDLKLLEKFPEAVLCIIDSNPDHPYSDWPGVIRSLDAPAVPMTPGKILVWQPVMDDPEEYDRFLGRVLDAPNPVILDIDELANMAATDSPLSYPRNLKLLLKQGRAAKKTTIVKSQDAAYILRQVLGQASHICRWRLQLPTDSAKINPYYSRGPELGPIIMRDSPTKGVFHEPQHTWGFWHVHTMRPASAREYSSWRQFV